MIYNIFTMNYRKKFLALSASDKLISIIITIVLGYVIIETLKWVLFVASWEVITGNFPLFFFGSYPKSELWRPILWLILITLLTLITLKPPNNNSIKRSIPMAWILMCPSGLLLLSGGLGLLQVNTSSWGGLTLTLVITFASCLLSLPLGIALALGRQSDLVLIRTSCKYYINLMRSLPLIAVLFFGQLMIPLFLPMEFEINRVARAIIAFTLFCSAYVAEDVRGGIQSIPRQQVEAGMVIGLNNMQIFDSIILPQALRVALPGLTNQAIGLLQNTSLMAILGLVELLGISRSLLANPDFIGKYLEVYSWLAAVYFLLCTLMALLAGHIESDLNGMRKR